MLWLASRAVWRHPRATPPPYLPLPPPHMEHTYSIDVVQNTSKVKVSHKTLSKHGTHTRVPPAPPTAAHTRTCFSLSLSLSALLLSIKAWDKHTQCQSTGVRCRLRRLRGGRVVVSRVYGACTHKLCLACSVVTGRAPWGHRRRASLGLYGHARELRGKLEEVVGVVPRACVGGGGGVEIRAVLC